MASSGNDSVNGTKWQRARERRAFRKGGGQRVADNRVLGAPQRRIAPGAAQIIHAVPLRRRKVNVPNRFGLQHKRERRRHLHFRVGDGGRAAVVVAVLVIVLVIVLIIVVLVSIVVDPFAILV